MWKFTTRNIEACYINVYVILYAVMNKFRSIIDRIYFLKHDIIYTYKFDILHSTIGKTYNNLTWTCFGAK